jgi:hypothetical protein
MTIKTEVLDTVLLLALPASGKSEVRKYLAGLSLEECQRDLCMGPTVQLDDFPYVHLMKCIDQELIARGKESAYLLNPDRPFRDARDWGTLIHLINEDYDDLLAHRIHTPQSAALFLFDRLDAASRKAGAAVRTSALDQATRNGIADAIEKTAREQLDDKNAVSATPLEGKTIVIEFARGGPHGSTMPLQGAFGYNHSLGMLSEKILSKAKILYVWVTPEESRRKNQERTDPNDPGSILHHGVPLEVMMNDYGCDDMEWLEANAKIPGTVMISAGGKSYHLPLARFDNRVDKTSFIRNNRNAWKPEQIRALHEGLSTAAKKLAGFRS